MTRRVDRVTALARQVAADAAIGPAPDWASQGAARPSDELLAKVAVWRAANQIDDTDLRPTGPRQPAKAAATYQSTLRALVQGGAHPSRPGVGPLLAEVLSVRQDPFVPVLAERLAAASRAGIDAAALVRQATTRPLPDDHAAAALWWRLAEHLAPAVATVTETTHLVSTGWAPALAEALGAARAQQVQSSPWWPVLVTTVDHALQRGWSLTDLAGTAPPVGADVDDAQAMTWTITTLMHDPTHLVDPVGHDDGPEEHEAFDVAPAEHSVQATDDDYRRHIEDLTTTGSHSAEVPVEDADEPDPVAVDAGLALAAAYRRLTRPLEPSEQELQRAYDRNMEANRSPVPLERLVAVNAMALGFYEQQLTVPGGWGRDYLADRLGNDVAGHPHIRPGYAPAGWTTLTDHLRRQGVTDSELLTSGLASTTRDGRLIDRFRDRAVFPITDPDAGRVLGFVGRRNPTVRDDTPYAGPKYLNTPSTPLFSKGAQLYGANRDLLAAGSTPVLVEGPMVTTQVSASGGYPGVAL